ncbi:50S ribosome-binding GTPase [Myxococcota bacterium]|nr:50S ribosome-binding GTPase [Myxococcota bacterium]
MSLLSPKKPEIPTDTIAALSTARGHGAIAVVRMSGARSFPILTALTGKPPGPQGRLLLRDFQNIDRGMAVVFYGPRSYTGEDMVELHCHGSPVITEELLSRLESLGARRAGPGEFTYRAVLNRKMALLDAERINARINAGSRQTLTLLDTSPGSLDLLTDLLDMAYNALADVESHIEFEEGEIPSFSALVARLAWLRGQASLTQRNASLPAVLLYGPPNCGKSTLFNAIIGYERALVSDTPGTTRDYLEAEFYFDGVGFRLMDSAGVRSGGDALEEQGVDRTKTLHGEASVVIDFSGDTTDDPRVVPVQGKADLSGAPAQGILGVSGVTRVGVHELLAEVAKRVRLFQQGDGWDLWIS